jgi:hypothetical protein
MPELRLRLACAAAVFTIYPGAAAAQLSGLPSSRPITIRVYDTHGLANGELRAASSEAMATLGDAGLTARWRLCRSPRHPSAVDRCDETLGPDELSVRVVESPADAPADEALADCYVVKGVERGVLATVFGDRVRAVAARTGLAAGVLVGRSIAHEIGHLLLRNPGHSTRGLMRARWSDDELRRQRAADWRFTRREAARLRSALLIQPIK